MLFPLATLQAKPYLFLTQEKKTKELKKLRLKKKRSPGTKIHKTRWTPKIMWFGLFFLNEDVI